MPSSLLPEDLSSHLSTIVLPLPTDLAELLKERSALERDLAQFDNVSSTLDVQESQIGGKNEALGVTSSSVVDIETTNNNSTSTPSTPSTPSTHPSTPATTSLDVASTELVQYKEYSTSAVIKNTAPEDQNTLTKKLMLFNELIIKREAEMIESDNPLLKKGMSMNGKGEMLDEEGLPFVGINFEEDEPYIPRGPTTSVPSPPTTSTSSTNSINTEAPKVRVGGLIQRSGKQILLKSKFITPTSKTTSTFSTSSSLPPSNSGAANKKFEFSAENEAILAKFEREEQEEAKAEEESLRQKLEAMNLDSTVVPPASSTSTSAASKAATSTIPPKKKALSGFPAGFLNKKLRVTPTASSSSIPSASATCSKSLTFPSNKSDLLRHETLHHILPPSKSIYRPTPPSSLPNTRPNSPRPSDKKVVFNLPEGSEEFIPKSKKGKEVIILGGPEPLEEIDSSSSPPIIANRGPAQRPLREVVVERPIKPPSEPKLRSATRFTKEKGDGLPIKTLGMAPKSTSSAFTSAILSVITPPSTSSPAHAQLPQQAVPIHTLSLSAPSNSLPSGHLSIANFAPEDPQSDSDEHSASELRPSLTSDGSDSDSSGFYGSDFDEDDEYDDEEEIDIDGALHNREVALEYHRLRMNLGAGAGTGPLGGDRDSESYDSWNQENVPTAATQQGRTPGSHSSRFRTGRLESAQMILPSLLSKHIRTNIDEESDDEAHDGLTAQVRDNLRNTLAELAGRSSAGGRSDMDGRRTESTDMPTRTPSTPIASSTGASIHQIIEEAVPSRPIPNDKIGQRMATPISLPSNPPLSRMREEVVEDKVENVVVPAKKLSRFKMRQLGLEPEI